MTVKLQAKHPSGNNRCQEQIMRYTGSWPRPDQCAREAVVGDRCRQHDPVEVAKKAKRKKNIDNAKWLARRKEIHGAKFLITLQQIANGHNDPRQLAQDVIDQFNK